MGLEDLIYERKSCRKYQDYEISEKEFEDIKDFIKNARTLDESIEFSYEILKNDDVSVKAGWSAPYYIAIYSERKDHYMENIGFIFQQLSLYLQSIGIGSCWVGMAKPKVKKDDFVIVMSLGKSDDIVRSLDQFKRKDISKFSDYNDERLKPAYYAPSAVNSQPWFFKHSDEGFDVYQVRHNVIKRKIFGRWNPIDIGICLAHLYVANPETFNFKIKSDYENLKGYDYNCSVSF